MRGFVNYYIDEDEENYEVVRGEKDVYKFKLCQTEIELRDPTKEDIPLDFKHDGIIFADHVTHVNLQSDFNQTTKLSYEKELADLLRRRLGNVCEIQFFDHNIRSEWTEFSRNSPAYHVHGDFAQDAAVRRIQSLLGDERAAEWFRNDGHVGILNVWRPINTVEKSPVGFIDISSVDDEKVPIIIIIIILRKLKT